VLRAVAEALDAEIAEFWRVATENGDLVRAGAWHAPEINGAAFDRTAQGVRIDAVTGEGQPSLFARLSKVRAEAADAIGLRSTTAIPALADETIVGAFLLFHRRSRQPDPEMRRLIGDVRDHLWSFLARPGSADALGLTVIDPTVKRADVNRVGGVAHELRNLLFVIGARAELLMEVLPAEVPRRRDLDTIIDAAQRAADLLRRARAQTRASDSSAA